jgi:FtsP/CotA-like multicopper oxidase with cupredoxin domain
MAHGLTRRAVLAAGGLGLFATVPERQAQASSMTAVVAANRVIEVDGRAADVMGLTVDGRSDGLTTRYGAPFAVRLQNALAEPTLIHWHGLAPPSRFDGVPMLSAPPLEPGTAAEYVFENRRTGTHWMHSHLGLQEQLLLAAPLIVKEAGEALVDEQEHVVMLHDFTFRDPREVLQELQGGGGLHAGHAMTMGQGGHGSHGASAPDATEGMATDVAFDAMLANDRTVADPEVVRAEKGGRFRLRIINGAAATNFWIELGALEGALIAVDGNAIQPVRGSRFPLAIAQRADIRLQLPPGAGSWPVLFAAEGALQQAAIVLQAGDGRTTRLAAPERPAAMLDLELEGRLRTVIGVPDNPVARTETVALTGGGGDYVWGFNGRPSMHDVLFKVKEGERYEIVMQNMTAMAHPMHLHGHYFRVTGIDNARISGALRDTVLVPAGSAVAIQFDADNPGTWAFHCHHLYHMNAGMMAAIAYDA